MEIIQVTNFILKLLHLPRYILLKLRLRPGRVIHLLPKVSGEYKYWRVIKVYLPHILIEYVPDSSLRQTIALQTDIKVLSKEEALTVELLFG